MRVIGIDLHDPTKAVRLIRLHGHVEARKKFSPPIPHRFLEADTLIIAGLGRLRRIAAAILVAIFLSGQDRAPGSDAAGAIREGADDLLAGTIGVSLQALMSRCRSADSHLDRA